MSDTFKKVYKPMKPESAVLIQATKEQAEVLEKMMLTIKSREMSLALTNLEQSLMWSTKAIVLNDKKEPENG
jgi:hypothetical protein